MEEIWKDVIGYEDEYMVSNTGKMFSLKSGKQLKIYKDKDGYHKATFSRKQKKKLFLIHREVIKSFSTNPENKRCVNHKDGNKSNNAIDNLEWCTHKENISHADSTGLRNIKGENNKISKLRSFEVLEIRSLYDGSNKKYLAKKYNVSEWNIKLIVELKAWKHI